MFADRKGDVSFMLVSFLAFSQVVLLFVSFVKLLEFTKPAVSVISRVDERERTANYRTDRTVRLPPAKVENDEATDNVP